MTDPYVNYHAIHELSTEELERSVREDSMPAGQYLAMVEEIEQRGGAFTCQRCSLTTRSAADLRRHVERFHGAGLDRVRA